MYQKPELTRLPNAVDAVRNFSVKQILTCEDSRTGEPDATCTAYEADE